MITISFVIALIVDFYVSVGRLLEQYAVIPTIDGHKLPFYAVPVLLSIPIRIGKMAIKMTQNQFSKKTQFFVGPLKMISQKIDSVSLKEFFFFLQKK